MPRRRREPPTPEMERSVVGPVIANTGGKRRVYTRQEVFNQKRMIEQLMLQGMSATAIHQVSRKRSEENALFGVSIGRIKKICHAIEERWVEEEKEQRPQWKSKQVRRLMDAIQTARTGIRRGDEWVIRPNLSALARLEELLARIQGTFAPVEVKVEHYLSTTAQAVIGDLSATEVAEALAAYDETHRLAERFREAEQRGLLLMAPNGAQVLPASPKHTNGAAKH